MSSRPRLQLKQPTGWFAAGREVAGALTLMPDPSFRLYLLKMLECGPAYGRLVIDPANLARVLVRAPAAIEDHLSHLSSHGVCHLRGGVLEIRDRFWPSSEQMPGNAG